MSGSVPSLPSSLQTIAALTLASMSGGECTVTGASLDPETISFLHALSSMGVRYRLSQGDVCVDACDAGMRMGRVDAGQSLACLVHVLALASDMPRKCLVEGRLEKGTSLHPLLNSYLSLGVSIDFPGTDWDLPAWIRGPHKSHMTHMPGDSLPSFISSMALSLVGSGREGRLDITGPRRPLSVNPALPEMAAEMGVEMQVAPDRVVIPPGQVCRPGNTSIPDDETVDTFIACLGLVRGTTEVLNIHSVPSSFEPLVEAGCDVSYDDGVLSAAHSEMRDVTVDARFCGDSLPTMMVTATAWEGFSRIRTDRRFMSCEQQRDVGRTSSMLRKMGCQVMENGDNLLIGSCSLEPAEVRSFNGPTGLAAALACILADGSSLRDADILMKRYPGIMSLLHSLGLGTELIDEHEQVFLF